MQKLIFSLITLFSAGNIIADIETADKEIALQHPSHLSNSPHIIESSTDNDNDFEDYDQAICDQIKPEPVSSIKAHLREMGINMYIRYLTVKDTISLYYTELKKYMSNLLGIRNSSNESAD